MNPEPVIDALRERIVELETACDDGAVEVQSLRTQLDEAHHSIQAARALHVGDGLGDGDWCKTCGLHWGWPCPTRLALQGRGT